MHFVHLIKNEDRVGTDTDVAPNPVLQLFLEQEVEKTLKNEVSWGCAAKHLYVTACGDTLSNVSITHSLVILFPEERTVKSVTDPFKM